MFMFYYIKSKGKVRCSQYLEWAGWGGGGVTGPGGVQEPCGCGTGGRGSGHGGAEAVVGPDGHSGLFQPLWFSDSLKCTLASAMLTSVSQEVPFQAEF